MEVLLNLAQVGVLYGASDLSGFFSVT